MARMMANSRTTVATTSTMLIKLLLYICVLVLFDVSSFMLLFVRYVLCCYNFYNTLVVVVRLMPMGRGSRYSQPPLRLCIYMYHPLISSRMIQLIAQSPACCHHYMVALLLTIIIPASIDAFIGARSLWVPTRGAHKQHRIITHCIVLRHMFTEPGA